MASGARVRVLVVCVFGLLLGTALPQGAAASVDVDLNVFVGALSPYGTWFDYPRYGRVWRPAHVGHGWRPYTDGRWVWSDRYGWVWDEDEDWGWATYHYGRWLFDNRVGWFWIPGYEWAPAWVSWRYGPSYVGWVPMGPSGFSIASYPYSRWSFVSHRHFFQPHLGRYAFVPDRRIFRDCRDEIRLDHRDGRWFNRGADRHHFERVSRERAPVFEPRERDRHERAHFERDRRTPERTVSVRPRDDDARPIWQRAPERDRGWRDRREARPAPQPSPVPRTDRSWERRREVSVQRPAAPAPAPQRGFERDRRDRGRGDSMRHVERRQPHAQPQAAPVEKQRAAAAPQQPQSPRQSMETGRGVDMRAQRAPGSWREAGRGR